MTVIEGVSVAGTLLDPMIIHQGKSHIVSWYAYVDADEPAIFVVSRKGWTDNELRVEHIREVFDKQTRTMFVPIQIIQNILTLHSSNTETRLLILDGHNSHMSPEFLIYAIEHNIIVLCLPSHTSHVLQPLDVGLFAQLQRYYSAELDKWTSHDLRTINRAEFFKYGNSMFNCHEY